MEKRLVRWARPATGWLPAPPFGEESLQPSLGVGNVSRWSRSHGPRAVLLGKIGGKSGSVMIPADPHARSWPCPPPLAETPMTFFSRINLLACVLIALI